MKKPPPSRLPSPPLDSRFQGAARRLDELWASAPDREAALRGVVEILHQEVADYHWVGIYVVAGDDLVVSHYRGKPTPHVRIPLDRGICGAAISQNDTIVVNDVKSDPRYLACSLETASEIVVPVRLGRRPVAELDIDSDRPEAFDDGDRTFLESIAARLSAYFADDRDNAPGKAKPPIS